MWDAGDEIVAATYDQPRYQFHAYTWYTCKFPRTVRLRLAHAFCQTLRFGLLVRILNAYNLPSSIAPCDLTTQNRRSSIASFDELWSRNKAGKLGNFFCEILPYIFARSKQGRKSILLINNSCKVTREENFYVIRAIASAVEPSSKGVFDADFTLAHLNIRPTVHIITWLVFL